MTKLIKAFWSGSIITANIFIIIFAIASTLNMPHITHRELTKAEINQNLVLAKTHEGSIIISWVKDIPKICKDDINADACSILSKDTCHIYLPVNMILEAQPNNQNSAHWKHYRDDELISHEILHCFVENWHEIWDTEQYYRNLGKK